MVDVNTTVRTTSDHTNLNVLVMKTSSSTTTTKPAKKCTRATEQTMVDVIINVKKTERNPNALVEMDGNCKTMNRHARRSILATKTVKVVVQTSVRRRVPNISCANVPNQNLITGC
jgi:hypothetical protein